MTKKERAKHIYFWLLILILIGMMLPWAYIDSGFNQSIEFIKDNRVTGISFVPNMIMYIIIAALAWTPFVFKGKWKHLSAIIIGHLGFFSATYGVAHLFEIEAMLYGNDFGEFMFRPGPYIVYFASVLLIIYPIVRLVKERKNQKED